MGGGFLSKIVLICIVISIFLPAVQADVEKVSSGTMPSDVLGNVLLFLALLLILVGAIIVLLRQFKRKTFPNASPKPKYYNDFDEEYYEKNLKYNRYADEKAIAAEDYIYDTDVEKHLKEEEMIIVRILRQRGNKCEQGTLSIVSGIPKASLSRLLYELDSRGIICKTKKGKKNIINLRI